MKKQLIVIYIIAVFLAAWGHSDTFTHKDNGTVYTGYAAESAGHGLTTVYTQEKGQIKLDLSVFKVEWNPKGRKSYAALLPIQDGIDYEYATEAFEKAISIEAANGPAVIIVELDTPGGYVHLAKRICTAIKAVKNCKTVAFISGGEYSGAYSAGAAISMACDAIYMAPGTSIGAASMLTYDDSGKPIDLNEAYGDIIAEKKNSAWRNYLASLAQDKHRSGALAKAMADKNIVVVEVNRNGKSVYIEPSRQYPSDRLLRTVCSKGELLTLPADNAVEYKLAGGIAASRQELLRQLGISDVEIRPSKTIIDADKDFEKAMKRFEKLHEKIDLQFKSLMSKSDRHGLTRSQALRDFEALRKSSEYLLRLKKTYPDIPASEESIQELVNMIKAEYASIKSMR